MDIYDIENTEELDVDLEKIGPQGYSAYELAKQHGFDGTEEEYLQSLHGEDGYTPVKGVDYFDGEQGEVGPQGIPGQDGKDAQINGKNTIEIVAGNNINIEQDEEGNLVINGTAEYDDTELKKNIETRALVTETGNKIVLEINSETFVITAKLEDKNGNVISTSEGIDLPLESVVVNAAYDDANKQITLTLQNGNTTSFSVADLVTGLVSEDTFNEFKEEMNNALENINVDLPIASADVLGGIKVGETLNIGEDGTLNMNNLNVYYRHYPNDDFDALNTSDSDIGYDILPTDPDGLYVCTGKNHSVGLIIHLSTIQYFICPFGTSGVYLFTRNYFTANRPWQSWNMKGSLSVRDTLHTGDTTGTYYKQAREAVNSMAVINYVGKLANLTTTAKTNIVNAINEVKEIADNAGGGDLPIASTDVLGGIKVGETLEIAEDGTLNALPNIIWINQNNITDYFEKEGSNYYIYIDEAPKRVVFMFDRALNYASSYLKGGKVYARPDREHTSKQAGLVFNSNAMCFWIDEFTESSTYYNNSINIISPGEPVSRVCYYFYLTSWQNRCGDVLIDRDTAQEIKGIKTFTALPKSTITPTDNAHLVNKAYVDAQIGAVNEILATLTTVSEEE